MSKKETQGVVLGLTVLDRFGMKALMPKEGDILSLTIRRDILAKTELSQKEIEKFGVKPAPNGGLMWEDSKATTEIIFTNAEMEFIRTEVDTRNKQKKLNPKLLPLCLKIRESLADKEPKAED